jgi:hypothetical protein
MPLVVHDCVLLLAESIECFVLGRVENLLDVKRLFSEHFGRRDHFAPSRFLPQEQSPLCIVKCNGAGFLLHANGNF